MPDDLTLQLRSDPKNRSLWERWYKSLYPKVKYRAFSLVRGGGGNAEDLVQDAFIKCLDGDLLEVFLSDEHAVNYIFQMVKSSYISNHRKYGRQEAIRGAYAMDIQQLHHQTPEATEVTSLPAEIVRAVKSFPPEDIAVLVGLLEGKSISDLASEMGLSYSAVGVRKHRLRRRLSRLRGKIDM